MATVQPVSAGQMLDISGVGEVKLSRYGEAFLNEISRIQALGNQI